MLWLSFSSNPWCLSLFAGDTKSDSGMVRIVGKGKPVESDPQPKPTDPYQCVCVFVEYLWVFCQCTLRQNILLFDTDLVFEFLVICPNLDWNSTSVSSRRVLSQWNSWGRHHGVFNGPNLDCPDLWRCHFCLLYPGELQMFHYHWAYAGCSLHMVSSASICRRIHNSFWWLAKAPSCSFPHLIVEIGGFRRTFLGGVSRILRDEPQKLLSWVWCVVS
jgi:hypothetical protein